MKKINLYCMAVVAVLMLLTSCLGDSGNRKESRNTQFAVARTDSKTFKTVLYVNGAIIYSPAAELQVTPGNCYTVDYEIDFNSPENANAATNGYYIATIGNINELDKGSAIPQITDTTALMENEQVINDLGVVFGGYIDGYMLIAAKLNQLKSQQTQWNLYYDMSQEVKENSNGERYYDMFVRAIKRVDGEGSTPSETLVYRVYEVKRFIEECLKKEKEAGKPRCIFRINYLKSINEKDSTDLKWDNYPATFEVPSTL